MLLKFVHHRIRNKFLILTPPMKPKAKPRQPCSKACPLSCNWTLLKDWQQPSCVTTI